MQRRSRSGGVTVAAEEREGATDGVRGAQQSYAAPQEEQHQREDERAEDGQAEGDQLDAAAGFRPAAVVEPGTGVCRAATRSASRFPAAPIIPPRLCTLSILGSDEK